MNPDDFEMRIRRAGPNVDQRVTSHNQSGGITAHTVNMGPQPRELDDELRAWLLANLPRTGRIRVVAPMGDPEAFNLADEVWKFLSKHPYDLDSGMAFVTRMPPPSGVVIDGKNEPGIVQVVIGHR